MSYRGNVCVVIAITVVSIGICGTGECQCQLQKVSPDVPGEGDRFGRAVAMAGDLAILGAINDDGSGKNTGAGYVYRRDGLQWTQEAKLTADDGESQDRLGDRVSIDADVAAVASRDHEVNGETSGAVYVFRRLNQEWAQEEKVFPADGLDGDEFGMSVSIKGARLVVGASHDDGDSGEDSGSVYVFENDGSVWIEVAKLTASDGAPDDQFGWAVSLSGDRIAVGARNASGHGAVYMFDRQGSMWTESQKLIPAGAGVGMSFGTSISLEDDVVLVGSTGLTDQAFVFRRVGSEWFEEQTILPDMACSQFGSSVALLGSRMIVGCLGDDSAAQNAGAAYIFEYEGMAWNQVMKLTATDASAQDQLGHGVALGLDFALCGAPFHDSPQEDIGAGYFFAVGPDCNGNETSDHCDLLQGDSDDVNGNGVPDECDPRFIRGDSDGDAIFNAVVDGISLLSYAFIPGSPAPPCLESIDVDGDSVFNGAVDGVFLLSCAFVSGAPCMGPPFPECGLDPDAGATLGCTATGCP